MPGAFVVFLGTMAALLLLLSHQGHPAQRFMMWVLVIIAILYGLLWFMNAFFAAVNNKNRQVKDTSQHRLTKPPSKDRKIKHTSSFSRLVAQSVLRKKTAIFAILAAIALTGRVFGLSEWSIWLIATGLMWYGADVLVVDYRLRKSLYGTTDIEVLEAARYVIRRLKSGGGGGHFDNVFEVVVQRSASVPQVNGEVAGAHS